MRTLTSRLRLNLSSKKEPGTYFIKNVINMDCYETLRLICAELNIDLSNVDDVDFEYCVDTLEFFKKNANDYTGYACSIWFDVE